MPKPHVFKFKLTASFHEKPKLSMSIHRNGELILNETKDVESISEGLLQIAQSSTGLVDKFNQFYGTPGSEAPRN